MATSQVGMTYEKGHPLEYSSEVAARPARAGGDVYGRRTTTYYKLGHLSYCKRSCNWHLEISKGVWVTWAKSGGKQLVSSMTMSASRIKGQDRIKLLGALHQM